MLSFVSLPPVVSKGAGTSLSCYHPNRRSPTSETLKLLTGALTIRNVISHDMSLPADHPFVSRYYRLPDGSIVCRPGYNRCYPLYYVSRIDNKFMCI